MSTTFSKLKDVDDRSKQSVLGYIRQIESLIYSKQGIIPIDIKNLCILYYFIKERWDPKAKHKNITIDGDSARTANRWIQGTAYLSNILDTE